MLVKSPTNQQLAASLGAEGASKKYKPACGAYGSFDTHIQTALLNGLNRKMNNTDSYTVMLHLLP